MQKVYSVVIEDRHCDTEVEIFSTEEAAIRYAKGIVKEFGRYPEDIVERVIHGYEYFCEYSSEGDCVSVQLNLIDAMEDHYK